MFRAILGHGVRRAAAPAPAATPASPDTIGVDPRTGARICADIATALERRPARPPVPLTRDQRDGIARSMIARHGVEGAREVALSILSILSMQAQP